MNLLQPQDKRSKLPGDTSAAVAARRRLHDAGVTASLFSAIRDFASPLSQDSVLDVGCGEGFYLGNMVRTTGCEGHGIDISIPAVDLAAKRYPEAEWVVANADRAIPYADESFSLVTSITARMNPVEFRRVLRDDGRLMVAIPAPDDLIELRGVGRDRRERTVAEFSGHFDFCSQTRVTTKVLLSEGAIEDIRYAIYRPMQMTPATAMQVTFSLDLMLFIPAV